MARFDGELQQIREQIEEFGRADAYLTFDGREVCAKVFDTISGVLDCKEHSGTEFAVKLDDLDDLRVDAPITEPEPYVEPSGPRPFTVAFGLDENGGIQSAIAPETMDVPGLIPGGAPIWFADENSLYMCVFAENAQDAHTAVFGSDAFQNAINERFEFESNA